MTEPLVRILDEPNDHGRFHLRSPVSTYLTLCGWCDCAYELVDEGQPTCESCLAVVRYVRSLKRVRS